MMRYLLITFLLSSLFTVAQQVSIDSLRRSLVNAREDTTKIKLLMRLGYRYSFTKPDSSLVFYRQGLALAKQGKLTKWEVIMLTRISYALLQFPAKNDSALMIAQQAIVLAEQHNFFDEEVQLRFAMIQYYRQSGKLDSAQKVCRDSREWARKNKDKNDEGSFLASEGYTQILALKYPEALRSFLAAIEIFQAVHAEGELMEALKGIGEIYYNLAEYRHSLSYYSQALVLQEKLKDTRPEVIYLQMGYNYAWLKMHDSAVYFAKKCYAEAERDDGPGVFQFAYVLDDIAEIYAEVGEDSTAMIYFRESLLKFLPTDTYFNHNKAEVFAGIAKLFQKAGQNDSAFFYASLAFPLAQNELLKDHGNVNLTRWLYNVSNIISSFYQSKHRFDSAFFYQGIAIAAKDSLSGQEKIRELQNIEFNEQLRLQQAKEAEIKYHSRINSYLFVGGIIVVLLVALFLYRNNRVKQRANALLQQQKEKVESTLSELRSTQAQLVQSEKMASLGELTAGIAHEIQNPLNFVNNFSDVNREMLFELNDEIEKGNYDDAKAIAKDVIENEEKINHHGKRADTIVKGMLQHSRTSSGQKELTDINALCDEYSRLAYHGLRAKDKSFNAKFETEFDQSIGKINIVPQDIGRVLLNLINNAFYAVSEKQKLCLNGYEPSVTIITTKQNGKVEIMVKDNGNGIPKNIIDKIFQPFFTTKPTGQGTGLGLSLAYDIIKAHGGEIKVQTKEGDGTVFIIQLPTTSVSHKS